jgi:hypothetical protein
MNAFTNTIREIWDAEHPEACIRVAGLIDGIRIRTPDDSSKAYFGEIDFQISADTAIELGRALIAAAEDSKTLEYRMHEPK